MDDFTFGLLSLFSLLAYLSTIIFFWAIYKENCAANNFNTASGHSAIGASLYPSDPSFRNYLNLHWKSLAISGIVFLGIFGFFITHVCDYQ